MYYIVPVYNTGMLQKDLLTPALRALHLVHIFTHMNVLSYTAFPLTPPEIRLLTKSLSFMHIQVTSPTIHD